MIWLTAAMAFFALCGVVVGILQWITSSGQKITMDQTFDTMFIQTKVMQGQLEQMKGSSAQTNKLITSASTQALASSKQADAAKITAEATKRSVDYIQNTQRAFVYWSGMKEPAKAGIGDTHWNFNMTWENSGETPARGRLGIDSCVGPRDLLSCFMNGEHRPDFMLTERLVRPFTLAPKGQFDSSTVNVTDETIEMVRKRILHLYIYGTATYTDVFGTSHITRFCAETVPIEVPGVTPLTWSPVECEDAKGIPIHSCIDDECNEEPQYPGETPRQPVTPPPA